MATIVIAPLLARFADFQEEVMVEGHSIRGVLDGLIGLYPQLKPYIYDEAGEFCSFVNIYLNDQDIRHLDIGAMHELPLHESDVLTMVPAIAGG